MLVSDLDKYVSMQINGTTREIFYNINENCAADKYQKIKKVIIENADLSGVSVTNEELK